MSNRWILYNNLVLSEKGWEEVTRLLRRLLFLIPLKSSIVRKDRFQNKLQIITQFLTGKKKPHILIFVSKYIYLEEIPTFLTAVHCGLNVRLPYGELQCTRCFPSDQNSAIFGGFENGTPFRCSALRHWKLVFHNFP